jgi:hypothetical protein
MSLLVLVGALCAPTRAALAQATDPDPPPPGLGAKLLEGPADNIDDPRAHEYIIDHVAPGATISRKVGFSNGDATPIDLSFYAAAADIADGAFTVGPDRASNDLTSWTSFSPAVATVQPGDTVAVTVTITVPVDASPGERYAAALAERAARAGGVGGVTTVSRVGIRLYLSVGTGGAPYTAFRIDSMTAARGTGGKPTVTAAVHNTGGRAVDLSGDLMLTGGPSSLSAGPFAARTVATLRPGASGTVSIELDSALPDGPWDARITLRSGVTTETGTARLTFPSSRGSSAPLVTVEGDGSPRRSPRLALGLGFVLLASVGLLWRRHRRARTPSSPQVAPAHARMR